MTPGCDATRLLHDPPDPGGPRPTRLLTALLVAACLVTPALASDAPDPRSGRAPKEQADPRPAKDSRDPRTAAAAKEAQEAAQLQSLSAKIAESLARSRDARSSPTNGLVIRVKAPDPPAASAAPRPRPPGGGNASAGHAAPRSPSGAPGHAAGSETTAQGHSTHWSYSGEGGPENWWRLKPEFARCAEGARQSPINIRGGIQVELEPIRFEYRASAFSVIDNGHTVQVTTSPGNTLSVMGRRYELIQFHFHRPAEERVDGRIYDMVAHLVHRDPEGRLAVVAVLLDRGQPNPVIQSVWNSLPLERNDPLAGTAPLELEQLLPANRGYYTYMGSLTTPPCSEGVLWLVMKEPVTVSTEQIAIFSRLYPMNARPLQPIGDRLVKESK